MQKQGSQASIGSNRSKRGRKKTGSKSVLQDDGQISNRSKPKDVPKTNRSAKPAPGKPNDLLAPKAP